jgi:energy-converting hydrogenase Eha subunit F
MEDTGTSVNTVEAPQVSRNHWLRGFAGAVAVFALTRLIVLLVAFHVPHPPATTQCVLHESPLIRWDAGHYLWIAEHGYHGLPATSEALAFFPGYSLVARLLMPFLPAHVALIVVTHLAALIGLCLLYAWCCRHVPPSVAFWCVCLVCCYPPAMYFSVGYADAMLFMCVALVLLLLELDRIVPAAFVSAYATLTRPTGLALAGVIVLYTWFTRSKESLTRRVGLTAFVGCVSVAGFLAYQGFLWQRSGRADAFFAAQEKWHGHDNPGKASPVLKIVTFKPIIHPLFRPFKYIARRQWDRLLDPIRFANPFFNLVLMIAAVVGLRRPGSVPRVFYLLPVMVFLMGYLPDPADGGRLIGIARYQLIALPCFLLLTKWMFARCGWRVLLPLCIVLLAYQCYYMHQFNCQVLVS